jgi:cbb3-type cytochrome oxidase maturation protein
MSVIYLLISISIIVAVAFLYAFLRAVKTGQYDDDYTPSVRMLFDDELVKGGKREDGSGKMEDGRWKREAGRKKQEGGREMMEART